jgi:hypothetical protein
MGSPLPTCGGCRRGCCNGHGYNSYNSTPGAGEPYSMHSMHQPTNMHMPCMGHCNPPKLYADTYSYLNNNLMQPVVQEVYNDLKTITPANTVMNNPMGAQMGLTQANSNAGNPMSMANNSEAPGGNMRGNPAANMNAMSMEQPTPMDKMGGMGPQIVNMIMGDSMKQRPGQMPNQVDQPMANGPQSQGMSSLNANQNQLITNMDGQYSSNVNPNQGQHVNTGNIGSFGQNPTMQYMTQPNTYYTDPNPATTAGNMQMGNTNPVPQQMQQTPTSQRSYGHHTAGVTKFNEMFPGVMQGGDLGFDPMAIAIQMNPANQQKAAMDSMQKLMNSTPMSRAMDSTRTALNQNQNSQQNSPLGGQQIQNQQNAPTGQLSNQQIVPGQEQSMSNTTQAIPVQSNVVPQQQQQIYSANTGAPQLNQQQMEMYDSFPDQYQQEVNNMGEPTKQAHNEGLQQSKPPGLISEAPQEMIKDPIFPADSSRYHHHHIPHMKQQKQYEYNTLGQPIEMLPTRLYHPPEQGLPQTLSPQPIPNKPRVDPMNYSNVKSTVSKTSLMGNKPTGRTPSRSQLQHIYNHYKGSQSYTQQNLKSPEERATFSEGKLKVVPGNVNTARAPVEKVGGDTLANNVPDNQLTNKVEQVMGQVGDVPVSKPQGDTAAFKVKKRSYDQIEQLDGSAV